MGFVLVAVMSAKHRAKLEKQSRLAENKKRDLWSAKQADENNNQLYPHERSTK